MKKLLIRGGRPLYGSVDISGAKNSVLPILAASVLAEGVTTLENCPDIRDVDSALSILRHLGCEVSRDGSRITVDSAHLTSCEVPFGPAREMRSSVIFLGPLAARCGRARLSLPGGCELGPRPVDLHIRGLESLGADVHEQGGELFCLCPRLRGAEITLELPSVGATENIMLAASRCGGTVIHNAAREPEICDLARYLNLLGADIHGAGSPDIYIGGGASPGNVHFRIMADRIEAATVACACAACGGEVFLRGAAACDMSAVLEVLDRCGCGVNASPEGIKISAGELAYAGEIVTEAFPGFPTDAQAPMMAAMCLARGETVFFENIFADRFRHVPGLMAMGADIEVSGRKAVVRGVSRLRGAALKCTDLRGGAAFVIAALAARGESIIDDIYHIDRGYRPIEGIFAPLGADIKRI